MSQGSSNPTSNLQKVAGITVDTNTGNASAGTQRVVLATNQPAVAVTGTFYQATQPVSGTFYQATQPVSGTFWQATQPISVITLPLPTGAATAAKQPALGTAGTASTDVITVQGIVGGVAQPVSGTVSINAIPTGANAIGSITNTSFAATQSGTWNIATLTNLSQLGGVAISMNTGVRDAGTQRVTIATNDAVPVTGTFYQTTQPVSGTFWQTTQPVSGPLTNTELRATAVPVSGTFYQTTQPVSAAALPLPTGAATAAKQPALGTAGTASADVITVQGIAGGVAQPVSGSVTVTQATAANLNATVTGTVELGATSLAALENISVTVPGTVDLGTISLTALETITVTSGTPGNFQSRGYGAVTTAAPAYTTGTDNALSLTTSGALRVDNSAVTQPVSGTFYQATQPVSGPLTNTELRATAVPVSGTLAFSNTTIAVTQPTPASLQATATQALGSAATRWYTQLSDGTNSPSIKAASTAAAATDPALVVAISPNNTVPVSLASVPTHGVTGTFWQATQPVSIATMPTTPVTGTFYQATQPVSQTVGSAATRWYTQISDGTNSPAIKAASTAAVAADPALVVAISPNNTDPVSLASVPTHGVTGTFWQATQPVSIATMPTTPVTGTFYQATQPVSATALPLPTGAATSAKQPALGTAGTASADVITVQGVASMTALKVDGSAVTQPVSGTFYQATQPVSIATMPTTPVTGTFWQTTQPVSIATMPSTPVTGTFWQATQPVSLTSVPTHPVTQSGNWIVVGAGANGATATGNPVLVAGSDGTNARSIKTATDGTLLINGVQDARQTANITTAASVVGPFSVVNRNVVTIAISGTYAGVTFVIEATDDGTNWFGLQCINNSTGQAASTWTPGTNALASYDTAVGGYTSIRVRATAWTSGTAVVGISNQVFAYDPIVAAIGQGTAASGSAVLGNPVLIGGSDGTNARNLSTDTTGALKLAAGSNAIGSITNTSFGVTGTFWQATQPVSIATMPSTPVTGTFWQATQPVSGTVSVNALPASTNVIGTVNLAGATTNALTNTTTTAYAASLIIKASAGTIYTLNGYNSKTSGQFIQLHNSATLPADTAVPVVTFYVPASSNFSFDWGVYGRAFSAGIVVTTSSTGPTKTIGAADCWFDATSK